MTSAPLIREDADSIATLTLSRPERHNALSPELICRLDDALAQLAQDRQIRCIIITGAGETSFCSGGDLDLTLPLLSGARAPRDDWDRRLLSDKAILQRTTFFGAHPGKPVIAAVNGACLAGGLELLLGTDIRIAAPHARFGLPEPRHGLIPFAGALSRLPKQIPPVVAAELLLTGDPIGAERAQQIGLVNHLAAPGDLMETARRIAGRIAANGPLAVAEITASLRAASPASEAAAAEAERAAMERVMASADAAEGPRAFIEKRAPRFTGG